MCTYLINTVPVSVVANPSQVQNENQQFLEYHIWFEDEKLRISLKQDVDQT